MRVQTLHSKWLLATAIVTLGVVLALGLSVASSYAFATTSDSTSPWVINIEPKDQNEPDAVDVDADYEDLGSGVEVSTVDLTVSDGEVSECTKTDRHIHCKATKLKQGEHSVIVAVKDRYGNTGSHCGNFSYDKVAPVIDNIQISTYSKSIKFVTVNYHDPSPSSGIASVVIYVDGQRLKCDTNGTNCYDDGGYDENHDGYDEDHDGSDQDHDGFYNDSSGVHHDSDGYFHDSDDDRNGSTANSYTCPVRRGDLGCSTHPVTVIVTDKAGNSTTGTAIMQNDSRDCGPSADTTPPVVTTSGNMTVEATGPSGAAATFTASAIDNVDGSIATTCSPASDSIFALGITAVTCSATDTAGNTGSATFTVNVVDTTPPVMSVPADVTVEATGPTTSVAFGSASATDIVDGSVPVTCSAVSGDSFTVGAHSVICSATDAHGNSSSGSFTVTVNDTTAPVLTLPADFTVPTTGSSVPVTFSATATDLVDGPVTVTCGKSSGDDFVRGVTVVSCSATDANGNTAQGQFQVTICQSGRPPLNLICPTFPSPVTEDPTKDVYWKDKTNRILTVRWTIVNGVGADAYNVKIKDSFGNETISNPLPVHTVQFYLAQSMVLPVLVGDIPSGGSVKVALDYYIPLSGKVTSFTMTACADDECGTTY